LRKEGKGGFYIWHMKIPGKEFFQEKDGRELSKRR
jgi:hypothetical protein